MSQYLILIYADEADRDQARAQEPGTAMLDDFRVFNDKNADALLGGNALQPTSTTTSVRPDGQGGFSVTDGPFAETKEALGGYYLIEAPDLDAAIALAKDVPVVGRSHAIEIRPIHVFS